MWKFEHVLLCFQLMCLDLQVFTHICFDGFVFIINTHRSLRKGIHDASSLIFKRRKVPHTLLDAWKSYRIPNLQQNILEPVITCEASNIFMQVSHLCGLGRIVTLLCIIVPCPCRYGLRAQGSLSKQFLFLFTNT